MLVSYLSLQRSLLFLFCYVKEGTEGDKGVNDSCLSCACCKIVVVLVLYCERGERRREREREKERDGRK